MKSKVTLGVFTVKRFCLYKGRYYTYGGFGNYIIDFSKYFNKIILLAHVIESKPPHGYYLVDVSNLEIVSLPYIKGELQVLLNLGKYFYIAKKYIHEMDLIQARMPDYSGIVGAVLAKVYNKPFFNVIIDDWYLQAKNVSIFKKAGLGLLLKMHLLLYDKFERMMCKGQVVLAQGETCYLKHVKHSKTCYKILSSAHNKKDIVKRISPKFNLKKYVILNVARLNSVKNQKIILKAISVLNKNENSKKWYFEHVGEGSKKRELQNLANKLGIENYVNFNGRVKYGDELWNFFDNADAFVLSSTSEGTPKVLLEACARGLPIVASDVSGVTTTIKHNVNGYIFESDNLSELVNGLDFISKNKFSRVRFQKNGIITASENTSEFRNMEMVSIISKSFPSLNIKCPFSN